MPLEQSIDRLATAVEQLVATLSTGAIATGSGELVSGAAVNALAANSSQGGLGGAGSQAPAAAAPAAPAATAQAALAGTATPAAPAAPAAASRPRGRPAGSKNPPAAATPAAAAAVAATSATPAAATPAAAAEAPAGAITYDQVRDKFMKVGEKRGVSVATAILGRFGVKNGRELKPEQYAAFIKDCDLELMPVGG